VLGLKPNTFTASCPAEAGHPVITEANVELERLGILDHSPSRMMTVVGGAR
jgi:hypothetical protein